MGSHRRIRVLNGFSEAIQGVLGGFRIVFGGVFERFTRLRVFKWRLRSFKGFHFDFMRFLGGKVWLFRGVYASQGLSVGPWAMQGSMKLYYIEALLG